ncbi:hypothetical protein GYMLUDRAFT_1006710 [Collybiopsis luxurians FD-317 M1]|uniref:Unplaced genomic scaffold GYMLUscaffold_38, whole genome shotgun sequence n=1 Tax=Collybiopsis luxurians FD-317 M1 TaxID=944289 RepID=A0A0D0B4N3_9AGAR|nr:hypothetical protein GYMLUDRAFT_1006710 [Collybiopsis luxurians FD-317 M1]
MYGLQLEVPKLLEPGKCSVQTARNGLSRDIPHLIRTWKLIENLRQSEKKLLCYLHVLNLHVLVPIYLGICPLALLLICTHFSFTILSLENILDIIFYP